MLLLAVLWSFALVCNSALLEELEPEDVSINLISGRDDSRAKFLEFTYKNKAHSVKLFPGILPVTPGFFIVTTYSDGTARLIRPDLAAMEKQLYENSELGTSVRVTETENVVSVEGILTTELRIKPSKISARSADGSLRHTVFKARSVPIFDNLYAAAAAESHKPNGSYDSYDTFSDEEGRQTQCVNVELLLVSDNVHQRAFNGDDNGVTWYCVIHANAGKLSYGTIQDPQMRLVVVGVVINKSPNDEPYITNNLVRDSKGEYIDGNKCKVQFADYFNQNKQNYKYDLCYLFTGRDLAVVESNGNINSGVAGLAYNIGVACTNEKYAIGEDRPGGSYMITNIFTHEVGHCLGAYHDGQGGTVASNCQNTKNVMGSGEVPTFSWCSVETFKNFIGSSKGQCLKSLESNSLYKTEQVPGDRITPDQWCQKKYNSGDMRAIWPSTNDGPCKVRCTIPGQVTYWAENGLDGWGCGNNNVCWLQECRQRGEVPWIC